MTNPLRTFFNNQTVRNIGREVVQADNVKLMMLAGAVFTIAQCTSDDKVTNNASSDETPKALVDPAPSHSPTKSSNPFSAFKYIG